MNDWLCRHFGHRWHEDKPVRVCRRCAKVERQHHIVIPYREYVTDGVLVKCQGRNDLFWIEEPVGVDQPVTKDKA